MWTKGELVDAAFGELGLAGYVFDLTPEERRAAVNRMDAMLALWESRGMRLGYLMSASPSTADLNSPSGLPDRANLAVFTNLAVMLASGYGKAVPPGLASTAGAAYRTLLIDAAQPQEMQLRAGMPLGAGNGRQWESDSFTPNPTTDPLPVDAAGNAYVRQE